MVPDMLNKAEIFAIILFQKIYKSLEKYWIPNSSISEYIIRMNATSNLLLMDRNNGM